MHDGFMERVGDGLWLVGLFAAKAAIALIVCSRLTF